MFINQILKKKLMAQQQYPNGISINDIPSNQCIPDHKILVIPHGIGSSNVNHLKHIPNINFANNIDPIYTSNDQSFESVVKTIVELRPSLVIAGSRGTELVSRLITVNSEQRFMLLGGVHLDGVMNGENKILLVHGTEDPNEKIEIVRGLTFKNKSRVKLVEVPSKSHDLSFDNKETIMDLINYSLSM